MKHKVIISIEINGVDGKVEIDDMEKLCDQIEDLILGTDIGSQSTDIISDWWMEPEKTS